MLRFTIEKVNKQILIFGGKSEVEANQLFPGYCPAHQEDRMRLAPNHLSPCDVNTRANSAPNSSTTARARHGTALLAATLAASSLTVCSLPAGVLPRTLGCAETDTP